MLLTLSHDLFDAMLLNRLFGEGICNVMYSIEQTAAERSAARECKVVLNGYPAVYKLNIPEMNGVVLNENSDVKIL